MIRRRDFALGLAAGTALGAVGGAGGVGWWLGRTAPQAPNSESPWRRWAEIAWAYYETSWDPSTGLPYSTSTWPYLTDWDLGGYLLTILAAERLGILPRSGPYGSDARIALVLRFLEVRRLTRERLPYRFYAAAPGTEPHDTQTMFRSAHPSDVGRLLIALDAIRRARPALAPRLRSLLDRIDVAGVARDGYFANEDLYPWYAAQGFRAWGFDTPALKPLPTLGGGQTVEVYGERFPQIYLTSEPVLHALLELDQVDATYRALAERLYRVQERRFADTGIWTAWSEGHHPGPAGYMYEWVVSGRGDTWLILDVNDQVVEGLEIAYAKVAFGFHALYGTEYTRRLVERMVGLATPFGFREGFANGEALEARTDKTNGIIVQAADHALRAV